jgi:ferredoxin
MAKVPVVDADLCTGCELCAESVPDVFMIEGDVAIVSNPEGADEEVIQEAIDNCPVEAISGSNE